jgi:Protein of unknown function (DUF3309)
MNRTALLIILIILLIALLPSWPYSTGWGYYPSGGVGLLLVILIVLLILGRI